MDKAQNRTSLALGIPGIILQLVGNFALRSADGQSLTWAGVAVSLIGTVLLIVGLSFYAKAKGRNPAWGLMGLLSIIGLIVLALLKDRRPNG